MWQLPSSAKNGAFYSCLSHVQPCLRMQFAGNAEVCE